MVVKLERKRYLLVEFLGDIPEEKELIYMLRSIVSNLAGQIGLAKSSLHVTEIIGNYAVVRCTNHSRDIVEAAIQLLKIPDTVPVIRTVSGTIKKLKNSFGRSSEDNERMIKKES